MQTTSNRPPGRAAPAPLAAAALLLLATAGAAQAQPTPPATPAWWAQTDPAAVDQATACAALAAWSGLMQLRAEAYRTLDTAPLAGALDAPELARDRQAIAALQGLGHGLAQPGWWWLQAVGGSAAEVVLYATYTTRRVPWDAAAQRALEPQRSATGQVAYRLIERDGQWRLADEKLFEEQWHVLDPALLAEVEEAYGGFWQALADAYWTLDRSSLAAILGEGELARHQRAVEALAAAGRAQRLDWSFHGWVLDATPTDALVAVDGTLEWVDVEVSSGNPLPSEPPERLDGLHRLQKRDDRWKVVDEVRAGTTTDEDGAVHIAGCEAGAG